MKIILIYPKFEKFLSNSNDIDSGLAEYFLGDFTTPPSLGIPIIASLTPPDITLKLIDDNSGDSIDYEEDAELVAISCFTPQAMRAFEIADLFRLNKKKVIMGGIFPTFMVDECLKHADSVNIGEVETTWKSIVEDIKNNNLKPIYNGGYKFDVSRMKIPDRNIFYSKKSYTWEEDLVQVTRGCLYDCAMCAIPAHMGHRIRYRPVEAVVEEVKTLKYENVYLADDVLFFPHSRITEYVKALFKALIPLKKKYFVSSTMTLKTDLDFIDLAAEAGLSNFYCTMNVDPLSIRAIQGSKKEQQMLVDLVKILEDRNIRFFGSFAIGRDWDNDGIAERILELYLKANIHTSEFFLFTPYPGTKHWDRLERQNRIFDKNWNHYNGAHVVAKHPIMSARKLYEQFTFVWKEFFNIQKHRHVGALEPSTYRKGKQCVGIPLRRKGVKGQAVISGIGILSPIGNDKKTVLQSLKKGISGLSPITKFDTSHFSTHFGGEIKGFNARDTMSAEEYAMFDDLYLQYAIATARNALEDSGVKWNKSHIRRDIALVLGTCNGGLLSAEAEYKWKHKKSYLRFNEKMNLQAQFYGFGKALSQALGIGGEVWIVTTACSSTTGVIGLAHTLIKLGYYDTVLLGGSDTLCVTNMSGFNGLRAVSPEKTSPFSTPIGLNIGEAACFWVVEEMEKAILRHTRCYGKIDGHATTSDAYHPTSPDPRGDGVYRTLSNALKDSGITISELGCINAHGTGTEANDRAECLGIKKFVGDRNIPVISLKSFFGHCMGSTGIVEATCNLLAMNEDFIPPTLNFKEPRPGCSFDYIPNKNRKKKYNAFISANYAFGGNNAAVVVSKWNYNINNRNTISRDRVVITGTGMISALGYGTNATVLALRNKVNGLKQNNRFFIKEVKSKYGGFVNDFKSSEIDRRLDFTGMNRISKFASSASSLALKNATLRINRKNAEEIGIVMGVCNGPSEMEHMDSVFSSENFSPNLTNFSNITANSTAGWVSNALCIKGVNMTLAPGPHAGIQCLAFAYDSLLNDSAKRILVCGADEIYEQTYFNYNLLNFLYQGQEEIRYTLNLNENKRKVLGEGAATVVVETLRSAKDRDVPVLAELLGYGMSMDAGKFN
ncbi:MAG: beta-ketoacyl synthase N-terminal-like domain-containing protein, partial [Chitinispirillia bacterium]